MIYTDLDVSKHLILRKNSYDVEIHSPQISNLKALKECISIYTIRENAFRKYKPIKQLGTGAFSEVYLV